MNEERSPRVAIVVDDGGPVHGVPWALTALRERPIPGCVIDVVGSERSIDAWSVRRPDLVHLGSHGRVTDAARAAARALGVRTVVSHHLPSLPADLTEPRLFLSPSASADALLLGRGVDLRRISRWAPGVETGTFHPARYAPDTLPGGFTVLYAGPLSRGHGLQRLADTMLLARERHPGLRLAVAGEGPAEPMLRRQLGSALTVLGPVAPEQLAKAYATADLLICPGTDDLFGQTILEAQASGLPVVAADAGAARELIETGRDGCLVPPVPDALAAAIVGLARRGALCDRLVTGGLVAARGRPWSDSRDQLAAAYAQALSSEAIIAPAMPAAEVARAA